MHIVTTQKNVFLLIIYILQMEETFRTFKTFLALIAEAETQLDQCRDLISYYPGVKAQLFKILDQHQKGYITPQDICQFYVEKNSKFSKVIHSIVERYFRFNQGALTLQEFSQILRSKNYRSMALENDENPFGVFYRMIQIIIQSYLDIEKVRIKLCEQCQSLEKYFRQQYHAKTLTRTALKEFMRQHDHYSREKFELICSYIFGDITDQILWSNLFQRIQYSENDNKQAEVQEQKINQQPEKAQQSSEEKPEQSSKQKPEEDVEQEEKEEKCEEVQCEKGEEEKEQLNEQKQTPEETKPPGKAQQNQFSELFYQIDNIEKALKQKKGKRNSANQVKIKSTTSELEKCKDSHEKIDSRISIKGQEKEDTENRQGKIKKLEEEFANMKSRYSPYTASKFKENRFSSSYENFGSQPKRRSKYFYNTSIPSVSRPVFQKSSSEAQFKIQQIQRRALNKYLIQQQGFAPQPYQPYRQPFYQPYHQPYQPYNQRPFSSKFDYTNFTRPHSPMSGMNSSYSKYRPGYHELNSLGRESRHYGLFSRSPTRNRY